MSAFFLAFGFAMASDAEPGEVELTSMTDEELVDRALDDDYEAFEELVRRYKKKAYRLAWSLVKEEAEAQDVVQEAFLNIYRKLHTFSGDAQLGSWIYRVVVNAALMRLRKRDRRSEIGLEDAAGEVEDREGTFAGRPQWQIHADEAAENVELREQILAAVDELDPKYQAAFVLREVEGLSLREIAEVLNLSEGAVKTRLHRARLHLRAALEPYLGRDESIK